MPTIFDSHAHYDDKRFRSDRDEVLRRLPEQGICYVLNAGVDIPRSRRSLALADAHDFLYCAVGIHPHEAKDAPADLETPLRELAAHPKVRAIGEIGLDFHYDFSPHERQREVFRRQLMLANELQMPVIIHDRDAHGETLEILQEYRPKGVVHCYSGSAEMAKELVKLGLYIGFTGVVTFKNARKPLQAVAAVPLDRLLLETDCPYMAPEPFRGKRCDSSMLPHTAQAMAQVKGIELQQMLKITCSNAMQLFGIE